MRAAASVDRLNMMGEGNSGRKLPSMPDSMQRSPLKISGREGEIAALKRTNRRSASSQNLVNSADSKLLFFFRSHDYRYWVNCKVMVILSLGLLVRNDRQITEVLMNY